MITGPLLKFHGTRDILYARDEPALKAADIRWRETKAGLHEALAEARRIWAECNGDHPSATKQWRAWMKDFKRRPDVTDSVSRYTSINELFGEPIFTGGNLSWPGGGGPRDDVFHPLTGKSVQVPRGGWRFN